MVATQCRNGRGVHTHYQSAVMMTSSRPGKSPQAMIAIPRGSLIYSHRCGPQELLRRWQRWSQSLRPSSQKYQAVWEPRGARGTRVQEMVATPAMKTSPYHPGQVPGLHRLRAPPVAELSAAVTATSAAPCSPIRDMASHGLAIPRSGGAVCHTSRVKNDAKTCSVNMEWDNKSSSECSLYQYMTTSFQASIPLRLCQSSLREVDTSQDRTK